MKLARYGPPGQERPAVVQGEQLIDVSAFGQDFGPEFFASNGPARLATWLAANPQAAQPVNLLGTVRLGPPVKNPGKLICIGLNYVDHARETGAKIPAEPIIFFKATSAIVGPNDDLVIPKNSQKTDWEVELAVVIGQKASYVTEADALNHVAGYMLHNDYSEREFQLERGGQWVKGKSCDTFAPLGPFLATPNELADVQQLPMWLTVNGQTKQNGNTSNMIFGVKFLVSYLSQFMSLHPGDVISTGTPAGVGLGFNPPQYLHPGDVVELGIEGLGRSRQVAKAWAG
jgi:2,4-didehydro-3-deoxy-L-rhamnonate hydrolase